MRIDLTGAGTLEFLRYLLANDAAKLVAPGKALYSCLLNEQGGVIDDLIVYFQSSGRYRLVVNAGRSELDIAWINGQAQGRDVHVSVRADLALLAVQGPNACAKAAALLPEEDRLRALALATFTGTSLTLLDGQVFVARTGYTGEDGFEIILPASDVGSLWDRLVGAGIRPCGLGARDTLRLEAGLNLYGNDMDETTSPLSQASRGLWRWTSPGHSSAGTRCRRSSPQALRGGCVDCCSTTRGCCVHIKSSSPAPPARVVQRHLFAEMERAIGLARVPVACPEHVQVEIRGKRLAARTVVLPFVRRGRVLVS